MSREVPLKKRVAAMAFVSALLISAIAGTLNIVHIGVADSVVNDWPMFHYDATHSGSPDNIAPTTHDLLWSFNTIASGSDPTSIISSSPAIVGGVVYIGSDDGNLYALNASTGTSIWSRTLRAFCNCLSSHCWRGRLRGCLGRL